MVSLNSKHIFVLDKDLKASTPISSGEQHFGTWGMDIADVLALIYSKHFPYFTTKFQVWYWLLRLLIELGRLGFLELVINQSI